MKSAFSERLCPAGRPARQIIASAEVGHILDPVTIGAPRNQSRLWPVRDPMRLRTHLYLVLHDVKSSEWARSVVRTNTDYEVLPCERECLDSRHMSHIDAFRLEPV